MAGAIVWAWIGQVDVIVTGTGKIVSNQQPIVMKPLELTVIKEINVKIGDIVEPGQILMTFDPTVSIAEADRLNREIATLSAERDRLLAEYKDCLQEQLSNKNQLIFVANKDMIIPEFLGKEDKNKYNSYYQDEFRLQKTINLQRQRYFQERQEYFAQTLAQIKASQITRENAIKRHRERLQEILKLEKSFEAMFKQKVTTQKEYVELKLSRMQVEASIEELENNLEELKEMKVRNLL